MLPSGISGTLHLILVVLTTQKHDVQQVFVTIHSFTTERGITKKQDKPRVELPNIIHKKGGACAVRRFTTVAREKKVEVLEGTRTRKHLCILCHQ
jgi:hypothetical protein